MGGGDHGDVTQHDESEEAGAEADHCWIIGDRGKEAPDLAIEVIWTSGSLSKREIYRRLGVREVLEGRSHPGVRARRR